MLSLGITGLSLMLLAGGAAHAKWYDPIKVEGIGYDSLRAADFSAALSKDRHTMYFSAADQMGEYRLFRATRLETHGDWDTVEQIMTGQSAVRHPWLSPDGSIMYYDRETVESGARVLRLAEYDSQSGTWSESNTLSEIHQDGANDICPSLTDDMLRIYFASDRDNASGVYDIWTAGRVSADQPFSSPQKLSISGVHPNCFSPYVSGDGLKLYYSAKDSSSSDWDLWIAERPSLTEPFSPRRLGVGSSQYDERSPFVTPDEGLMLYGDERGLWSIKHRSTLHVDTSAGSDLNSGETKGNAFKTIQKAIEEAENGDTVLVWPGEYSETVDFLGKAITVKAAGDPPVISSPGSVAVWFFHGEGRDSKISNFIVKGSSYGVFCLSSSPTINNLTIVNNDTGIWAAEGADPLVENCILWDNVSADIYGAECSYSCTEDAVTGLGNINEYPLFADPAKQDFHLLSEAGRFLPADPNSYGWQTPQFHPEFNDEYGNAATEPCFTDDGLTVVFHRYVESLQKTCLFEARRSDVDQTFEEPELISELSQMFYSSKASWISNDKLRMYFNSRDTVYDNSFITMAVRDNVDSPWRVERQLGELHENGASAASASLSEDELIIVFKTYRSDPWATDLWIADRNSTDEPFSSLRALDQFNTNRGEGSPCLSADGLTLYFSRATDDGAVIIKAMRSSRYEAFADGKVVAFPGYESFRARGTQVDQLRKRMWFCVHGTGIYSVDFNEGIWTNDAETSPGIDAGDPAVWPEVEPAPNGGRINMGAYGATSYASKSLLDCWTVADLNCDGIVNWADHRPYSSGYGITEVEALAENWLNTAAWYPNN
ncbi:right-handed parallel beta-helix repeat-containing protein [Anaerohalosphaera lusitana]|uniref:right-handed parallel beta-helix repeat-containing protein n=1 Tax=Anaerohalosphaera lusitana TaxID=1936003 RepID=UPI00147481D3|nr:right-handed parallel beta-helix repeat-containing protein [Anaerohalosphaera lusitana]